MKLKGKTALIAGAGRNNGRAIALEFAAQGADLVLISRERRADLEAVEQECKKLGANTIATLADMSKPGDVNRAVEQGTDRFGKIDISVSVAGLRQHRPIWEVTVDEWLRAFEVNLHPTFYLAKALMPGMMKRRYGNFVALGGLASMTSQSQRASVVASKTGLYGLIKSLALELGPYNIRANLIALSMIANVRLNPEWYPEASGEPQTNSEIEGTALKRQGAREEVAKVALFLASDDSSYVTGDRVLCCGGKYM